MSINCRAFARLFPGVQESLNGSAPTTLFTTNLENAFHYQLNGILTAPDRARLTAVSRIRRPATERFFDAWDTYTLFSAEVSLGPSALLGNGMHDVFSLHDYRISPAEEPSGYKAERYFTDAEAAASKLRTCLDGITRTAGLTRERGAEPTVLDYLRAPVPAGVERPDLHAADLAELRRFALAQLSLLLPQAEVDKLSQMATPLRMPDRANVQVFPAGGNVVQLHRRRT